jgi:uncharacterized protein YndB with AHSA1/START domain
MQNTKEQTQQKPVTATARAAETARAICDGEIVLATIDVPAPPDRVVRALTTAECERWWGAAGVYTIESWQASLRPGGTWSLVIRLPDGTALPSSGEFVEVTPQKIVQTRRYDFDHPTLGRRVTKVVTLLSPTEHGTHITVRHDGFGSAAAAIEHAGGWERMLDWLGGYLRAATATATATAIFGNHMSVIVPRKDRHDLQRFYCEVLGGTITKSQDDRDFIRLGDDFYVVLYGDVPDASEFLRSARAVWLEIKSDDVEGLARKILDFGARKLEVPDPHLYFQAPGGQCLRLVGIDEDLSFYEGAAEGPDVKAHLKARGAES